MPIIDLCTDHPNHTCPGGTVNVEVSTTGRTEITQQRNRLYMMLVGGTSITLQSLIRNFSIEYHGDTAWADQVAYLQYMDGPFICGTKTGTGGASIHENINIVDTELYYLDHINRIMFWRESTETCNFDYIANKTAVFRGAYGDFNSHWFEVQPSRTITDRYKLLVNGVVEIVETVNHVPAFENVINVLFPLPPSDVGPTGDPDDSPVTFYDYFMDEALREADGGVDWYYPSWMRSMGINKAEDQLDALERYELYFNGSGVVAADTESIPMPTLPAATPKGNAVVDADGNILLSFTGKEITINRLYKKINGAYTMLNLNTLDTPIMAGDNLKLYPVGIVD